MPLRKKCLKLTHRHCININVILIVVFKNLVISIKNVTYHARFLYGSLTIKACEHDNVGELSCQKEILQVQA